MALAALLIWSWIRIESVTALWPGYFDGSVVAHQGELSFIRHDHLPGLRGRSSAIPALPFPFTSRFGLGRSEPLALAQAAAQGRGQGV